MKDRKFDFFNKWLAFKEGKKQEKSRSIDEEEGSTLLASPIVGVDIASQKAKLDLIKDAGVSPRLIIFLQAAQFGKDQFLDETLSLLNANDKQEVLKEVNNYGSNALQLAALNGHASTISVLLKHGISTDHLNKAGKLAIHLCVQNQHNETKLACYSQLLGETSDEQIKQSDVDGENLLFMLVRQGMQREALQMLREYQQFMTVTNKDNESLLHLSVQKKADIIYPLLINNEMLLQVKTCSNATALHYAADAGNTEAASQILEKAPQLLDMRDLKFNTPLHYAAKRGNSLMVELLLSKKASTNIQNEHNKFAADMTEDENCIAIFKKYRDCGLNSFGPR